MTRGEFEKLTERYRLGKCSLEEIAFVGKWVEANYPVDSDNFLFENEDEAAEIEEEIWNSIGDVTGLSGKKPAWQSLKWFLGSVAACLGLVLAGILFWRQVPETEPGQMMTGLETHNTSGNSQRIVLPDSSVIILAEGGSIVSSESYGQRTRAVRLKGEAFFEVRPNPKVPFIVYSENLVTEVLGTSFRIKPGIEKKTIEVSVVTGKVSVYSGEKDRDQRRRGVIIVPNQKAVYDTESKTIRQDLVDAPRMVKEDIPESVFIFDEVPVKTVLSILQNAYGMEIVVSNPELNDCVFRGNLNGFDLFQQLSYICEIIDAQYEVRGTTIFLTGKGCRDSI